MSGFDLWFAAIGMAGLTFVAVFVAVFAALWVAFVDGSAA